MLGGLVGLNLGCCVIGGADGDARPEYWRPLVESPNLARLQWLGLANIDEAICDMWRERFSPNVLECDGHPFVPWQWHRWNRYFPAVAQPEFVVADCVSPIPRRMPQF